MSSMIKYLVIGTATLALSLTAACKDDADSSGMKQEMTEGAESAGKAGAAAGMEAGKEGGMKEGTKEGGKAAATDVVN